MRARDAAVALLAVLGLAACATAPPPSPPDPSKAHLAISLDVRGALSIFHAETTKVCFARLAPDQADLRSATPLLGSNHSSGNTFYLLNAEPGRYVAVVSLAAGVDPVTGIRSPERDLTVLPEDLVRGTDVTAEPGSIAFMGEYCVHSFGSLAEADATQRFYAGLFAPAPQGSGSTVLGIQIVSLASTPPIASRGRTETAKRDAEAEAEFRKAARVQLADPAWAAVAEKAGPGRPDG
ncbi:MAG TPA: hypothetical protein VKF62_04895 [Planctomycetota bacterium]|nr:hypothetical protein [Planctomycetota bacterium]